MTAVQKNEDESMIPKWKKVKISKGKENIFVLPKEQYKQRRKKENFKSQ